MHQSHSHSNSGIIGSLIGSRICVENLLDESGCTRVGEVVLANHRGTHTIHEDVHQVRWGLGTVGHGLRNELAAARSAWLEVRTCVAFNNWCPACVVEIECTWSWAVNQNLHRRHCLMDHRRAGVHRGVERHMFRHLENRKFHPAYHS